MDKFVKDLNLQGVAYSTVRHSVRDNNEVKRRDIGLRCLTTLPEDLQRLAEFNQYKHQHTNYTAVMHTVCRHTEWSYDQVKAVVANLYRQLVQPQFAGPEFRSVALIAYRRALAKVRAQVEHQPCIR
jgi:hypothetical protein